MPRAPARTQTAYEKLVSPSRAIAMGRPRGRSVTVDEHVHALTKEAAIMEATARDDERFALECVARATNSADASEIDALLTNALRNGAWSVERDFCRANLRAFIAGMRCAQRMSAPRKASPRSKAQRRRGVRRAR
jgi:hypothetical protein